MHQKKLRARLFIYRRILILLVLCLGLSIALPGKFLTLGNFRNILYAISLQGIMICGATFPVLLAGIDRTVSGSAALAVIAGRAAICGAAFHEGS